MLVHFDRATSAVELKEALETGSAEEKADAMKKVISLLLSFSWFFAAEVVAHFLFTSWLRQLRLRWAGWFHKKDRNENS